MLNKVIHEWLAKCYCNNDCQQRTSFYRCVWQMRACQLNIELSLSPQWDQAQPNITKMANMLSSQWLTGCCGASLSILKTCATFPLALRCILNPGMAQRVARLIILDKWKRQNNCLCLYQHQQSTPPVAFSSQPQVVCLDWTQLSEHV